jgi:hypothetical protein
MRGKMINFSELEICICEFWGISYVYWEQGLGTRPLVQKSWQNNIVCPTGASDRLTWQCYYTYYMSCKCSVLSEGFAKHVGLWCARDCQEFVIEMSRTCIQDSRPNYFASALSVTPNNFFFILIHTIARGSGLRFRLHSCIKTLANMSEIWVSVAWAFPDYVWNTTSDARKDLFD